MDSGEQEKSNACIRVVRLAEGATERSVLEGSGGQARNCSDPGIVIVLKRLTVS
jgi:hypothetical protein